MKKINDLKEALVIKIQALYDIEKQLEKALPKLAKASSSPELKKVFLDHLEETKGHSGRLEEIFTILSVEPKTITCEGIRGIIEDGDWITKTNSFDSLKDSMIAGAARYAEHYEMAGYMGAIEEATMLGLNDVVDLLKKTLSEEENGDKKLEEEMRRSLKKLET